MRVLANPCVTTCSCLLDALKMQFVEAGVPEALSEMIRTLQGGSDTHDLCSIKVASNLIVSLLLGGTSLSIISPLTSYYNGFFYLDYFIMTPSDYQP